ncbi:MAG: hypothetical protein ABFD89_03580 [Bryobacteraceae bacterium]
MSIQSHQFDRKLTPPRRDGLTNYWSPPSLRDEVANALRVKFLWLVDDLTSVGECDEMDLDEILAPKWLAERGIRGAK